MTDYQPLSIQGNHKAYIGHWRLIGETLEWTLYGEKYRIESDGDLANSVENFVRILGKQVLNDDIKLKACLTCQNFQMSAMARDMGRGQRGVCNFHKTGAEICHLCIDYKEIERKKNDTKSYLLEMAPLHLFWLHADEDQQPSMIHFLGEDGIAYIVMDDDEQRLARCINFLMEMNCPVFTDINEEDEYVKKLTSNN